MDKVFTRRLRVSAEDMARVNETIEKFRQKGVPENELKEYFNGFIKIHGVEVSIEEELNK